MSEMTGDTERGPQQPLRPGSPDPWPHEHGEHPSGLSLPDGGSTVQREQLAHLVGDPVVIDPSRARRRRAIAWAVVCLLVAVAVVGLLLFL